MDHLAEVVSALPKIESLAISPGLCHNFRLPAKEILRNQLAALQAVGTMRESLCSVSFSPVTSWQYIRDDRSWVCSDLWRERVVIA